METIEDALTAAIPALEDLLDLAARRVDPESAADIVARARSLVSTIAEKIEEAEGELSVSSSAVGLAGQTRD